MTPASLLLCLCLAAPDPPRDRWIGEDKWKHFFGSFVATSLSASVARAAGAEPRRSAAIGAGVGAGFGIWKELRDAGRRDNRFSPRDLVWDMAGVAAAASVVRQVR